MLAVVNMDQPLFPGNLETFLTTFDTCVERLLVLLLCDWRLTAQLLWCVCSGDAGLLAFPQFVKLYKRYPIALYPIFRLHHKVPVGVLCCVIV